MTPDKKENGDGTHVPLNLFTKGSILVGRSDREPKALVLAEGQTVVGLGSGELGVAQVKPATYKTKVEFTIADTLETSTRRDLELGTVTAESADITRSGEVVSVTSGNYAVAVIAVLDNTSFSNHRQIRIMSSVHTDLLPPLTAAKLPLDDSGHFVIERFAVLSFDAAGTFTVEGWQNSGGNVPVSGRVVVTKLA